MERKVFRIFPDGAADKSKYYSQRLTFRQLTEFMRTGKTRRVHIENKFADYVVLDLKRPWFSIDVSCSWELNKKRCKNSAMTDNFIALVEKVSLSHETVFEKDGFIFVQLFIVYKYLLYYLINFY